MARTYGDWEIADALDEGGQAHVFIVRNIKDKRRAVLKRLKNNKRLDRFQAEFKVMQRHDGQFFPKVLDADLSGDRPYFVMEYFERGCLTEELVKNWSLKDKLNFYTYLILAVACANNEGVIHRDLKPGNILVTDDNRPRVTDFGLCYLDDYGARQTLTDEAVGSFRFMAPEMEDGKSDKIGQQTDIYSLGKIGYWLFAGKIYNRERHRDPQFDLTKESTEPWRFYFNDFLDRVTNHDPDARPRRTAEMVVDLKYVQLAITDGIRYLDLKVDQICSFCRFGKYQVTVDALDPNTANTVRDFGFVPVGASKWLILSCDQCGNVQTFRKDLCEQWKWKDI
ncbi:MAG: serine/threonine protein kinase [Nitrospira sp.]|nr:serine/threonine protein kinase [Nitrospira sp.]